MSHKKPEPLHTRQELSMCPICGKVSYSAAGIHPQCAVRQADEKRTRDLKRDQLKGKTVKPKKTAVSRWQKICPSCKLAQHVRKKDCSCGHKFEVNVRPPAGRDGSE